MCVVCGVSGVCGFPEVRRAQVSRVGWRAPVAWGARGRQGVRMRGSPWVEVENCWVDGLYGALKFVRNQCRVVLSNDWNNTKEPVDGLLTSHGTSSKTCSVLASIGRCLI